MTENENEELKDIVMEGFPAPGAYGRRWVDDPAWGHEAQHRACVVQARARSTRRSPSPPYASGGVKPSEKNRTTTQKYSSMRADEALPDFDGDQKDQRSWTRWMAEWLSDVRKACKEGAVLCVFIDWRMAPCLSDAVQWAGWIWRGQVVWDKMTSRPQKGRYRQQSEYMLWASNGPLPNDLSRRGALPGVFRYTNPAQAHPCAGEAAAAPCGTSGGSARRAGASSTRIAGAGTTSLAAVQEGHEAAGAEVTDAYYRLGGDRARTALAAGDDRPAGASATENRASNWVPRRDEYAERSASTLDASFPV